MKYELIIKEIESGEVVCQRKCDCVIGAVAGTVRKNAIGGGSFNYIGGTVASAINAVKGAEESVDQVKKAICEYAKKVIGDDITYEELADFVEQASLRISVNEDDVKAVANGEVAE